MKDNIDHIDGSAPSKKVNIISSTAFLSEEEDSKK